MVWQLVARRVKHLCQLEVLARAWPALMVTALLLLLVAALSLTPPLWPLAEGHWDLLLVSGGGSLVTGWAGVQAWFVVEGSRVQS